jgi:hypothetical protein
MIPPRKLQGLKMNKEDTETNEPNETGDGMAAEEEPEAEAQASPVKEEEEAAS